MPHRPFILVILATLCSLCGPVMAESNSPTSGSALTEQAFAWLQSHGIRNLKQPQPGVFTSGQPSPEQFAQLQAAGVKHIINLRPDAETGSSEQSMVEAEGLIYHHLPIAGAAGVTYDNATKLKQMLDELAGEPVLVHCASGNRVGGLIALQSLLEGETLEQAVVKGKDWGMTRLEARVRKLADRQECESAC